MRAFAILLCLVATTLAGCSGESPQRDDAFDDFGDVDVDSKTGVIRGLVIDPLIVPIDGALVQLGDTGQNATTNEKGAFLFQGLAPGLYFLHVSKPGYETIQSSAEVKAGIKDPPIVRVQLVAIPGLEPRYVPLEWQGHLGCTFRRWDPPSGGRGESCPAAGLVWEEHDSSNDHELEMVPTYVTSDLVWQSTQRLGGEMSFNLRRTDTNCDTVDIEGTSPLHLFMDEATIQLTQNNCPRGGFGPDMPLRIAIFTAHLRETEPPTGGWGFGLQIDQPFNTYTHIFYNYEPPADWRFTDDSTVPGP